MKFAYAFLISLIVHLKPSAAEDLPSPLVTDVGWGSIVSPLLANVLSEHGDGPVVSNVKAHKRVDPYIDLTVGQPLDSDSTNLGLTNVLDYGSSEETQNGVRTINSHVTLSCICSDIDCKTPHATDISGAVQVDAGDYVGMTPLLVMNPSAEKVPCLSLARLKLDDISVQGCELDDPSMNSDGFLRVKNCSEGNIENLRVFQHSTGNLMARPLNADELWPNLSDPNYARLTLAEILQAFEAPPTTISLQTDVEVDLGEFDLGDFDLGDIDLSQVPVGEINVGNLDLGVFDPGPVDLENIDLGTIDLGELYIPWPVSKTYDFGDIDLGDITIRDVDLGPIDVGVVDFGTIDFGVMDLGDFNLGDIDIGTVTIGTRTFGVNFTQDVTEILQDAELALFGSVLDSFGSLLLPNSFKFTPASKASLADYMRILLAFSIERLRAPLPSTRDLSEVMAENPLYLDLLASRPETSTTAEIINGCVLLSITACLFGWFLGRFVYAFVNRRGNQTDDRTTWFCWFCKKSGFWLCIGSVPPIVAESIAYGLRWKADKDLEDWERAMVLVDTTTASRVSGALPLTLGRDGNIMTVSIISTELSSDDPDRYWIFGLGLAFAILFFLSAIVAGCLDRKEKNRKKREEKNHKKNGSAAGATGGSQDPSSHSATSTPTPIPEEQHPASRQEDEETGGAAKPINQQPAVVPLDDPQEPIDDATSVETSKTHPSPESTRSSITDGSALPSIPDVGEQKPSGSPDTEIEES